MTYKTKTYIAGDWTADKDAVDILYEWNTSNKLSLSFTDAHDLTQARDNSLNCSIKASLKKRFDISKTFVLVVGSKTNSLKSGSCKYCNKYFSFDQSCLSKKSIDLKSYIEYECQKAIDNDLKIVVLYKSVNITKSNCPEIIKDIGTHIPMRVKLENGIYDWDYKSVKNALK